MAYGANPVNPRRTGTAIKARILSSPSGTVILIYMYVNWSARAHLGGVTGAMSKTAGENEVFVYVSKDSLVVTEVILGVLDRPK